VEHERGKLQGKVVELQHERDLARTELAELQAKQAAT
jgi:hypothetical protein